MCVLPVGMAEVSTCEITVYQGQHVKKGDQPGMFHFGGSTHCLMFRPGVRLDFDFHGQTPGLTSSNIPGIARCGYLSAAVPSRWWPGRQAGPR
jgi:phosphatidylserine decarboxylase